MPFEPGVTTLRTMNIELDNREASIVLAALRNWQEEAKRYDLEDFFEAYFEDVDPPSDTEIDTITAPWGLPYIATRAEATVAGHVILKMLAGHHRNYDAAVIAAFGDPGLGGARELFDIPIVGISEAAMLTAWPTAHADGRPLVEARSAMVLIAKN